MPDSTSARDEILARIRAALPPVTAPPRLAHSAIQRTYSRAGKLNHEATLELFLDRLHDYDADVIQVADEAGLPAAIAQALEHANEQTLLASADFPTAWLPEGPTLLIDHALTTAEINQAQAVVTTCESAVAATGTITLVHQGSQGRRITTLLPDHHICLVRRDQVAETIPESWQSLAPFATLPITTISGPSATSDIEMTRIRGVHGPRRLTVILYGK